MSRRVGLGLPMTKGLGRPPLMDYASIFRHWPTIRSESAELLSGTSRIGLYDGVRGRTPSSAGRHCHDIPCLGIRRNHRIHKKTCPPGLQDGKPSLKAVGFTRKKFSHSASSDIIYPLSPLRQRYGGLRLTV